ncbi:MAG: nitroreductase/quinone reductase family protein [Solirubrobacterales bacterium]
MSAATESDRSRPLYERLAIPLVSSRPGSWFYVHVAPHLDRGLLRLTGGRVTTAGRGRVGFLVGRGARTGVERTTPLVWTQDSENVLLVASRGGDVKHPAWYLNAVANPDVSFSIDGTERPYRARAATAEERPRLWELVNRRYPGYAVYQRRAADREIPIVVLEPRS